MSNEEVKAAAIRQSMDTIDMYRGLMDALEKDLNNAEDEAIQQAAALAIRTFHLFITQQEGYNSWNQALRNLVTKELMSCHNITEVH
jgi:hypothetical protein